MSTSPCARASRSRSASCRLEPLYTPGHTDDHHAYLLEAAEGARVFTGDALMIDGCGRTDFQNGDAATLYRSVHDKIFALPDDTLVYPGHDYQQRRVSSVGQERARNPRLGGGKTRRRVRRDHGRARPAASEEDGRCGARQPRMRRGPGGLTAVQNEACPGLKWRNA